MSLLSVLLIGLAMSADAFAAAIAKGAAMGRPCWRDARRAGVVFGAIETLTPILGWLLGRAASSYVAAFDHWIAFCLLGALGTHMIVIGLRADAATVHAAARSAPQGLLTLVTAGLATSIDAMAVGVSLAFLNVQVGVVAMVIGLCTLSMVTVGIMLGRVLGTVAGKRAEIMGGVILVIVGSTILYEHLQGGAGVASNTSTWIVTLLG